MERRRVAASKCAVINERMRFAAHTERTVFEQAAYGFQYIFPPGLVDAG